MDQIAKADIVDVGKSLPRSSGYARVAVEDEYGRLIKPAEAGYFNVPLYNQVVDNLWQGGCKDGFRLPDTFESVISLYPWEKYEIGSYTTRNEFKLFDSLNQDMSEVEEIVSLAYDCVKDGPTLIHCQAGLNRSGLIAGRVLMLGGMSAGEAITILRETRGTQLVLCNKTFEDYLFSKDHK